MHSEHNKGRTGGQAGSSEGLRQAFGVSHGDVKRAEQIQEKLRAEYFSSDVYSSDVYG
jgi:hypothetical protein